MAAEVDSPTGDRPAPAALEPEGAEPESPASEAWLESSERQQALLRSLVSTFGFYVLSAVAALFVVFRAQLGLSLRVGVFLGAGFGLLAIAALVYALYSLQIARFRFQQRIEAAAKGAIDTAIGQVQDASDLQGLLRLNRKQIEEYQVLAKGQAKTSYWSTLAAMGLGMLILVAGVILAVLIPNTTAKISAATLSGVGGLIGGYIGKTFLTLHNKALSQLNFYFRQPLVASYILNAERLIDRMSAKERDRVVGEIITTVLDVAAQRRPSSTTTDEAPEPVEAEK